MDTGILEVPFRKEFSPSHGPHPPKVDGGTEGLQQDGYKVVSGTAGLLTSLTLYINQESCIGMWTRCLAVTVTGTRPSRSELLGGVM